MSKGEVIQLVSSDPDSLHQIPRLIAALGDELLAVYCGTGQQYFLIKRLGDCAPFHPRRRRAGRRAWMSHFMLKDIRPLVAFAAHVMHRTSCPPTASSAEISC